MFGNSRGSQSRDKIHEFWSSARYIDVRATVLAERRKKNVTASTDNLTIFCGTAISISLVLAKITMGKEFFAFQSGREPAVSVDDGIRWKRIAITKRRGSICMPGATVFIGGKQLEKSSNKSELLKRVSCAVVFPRREKNDGNGRGWGQRDDLGQSDSLDFSIGSQRTERNAPRCV